MTKIKSVLGMLDSTYLIKSYILSAILTFFLLVDGYAIRTVGVWGVILILISGLLFPFAAFVWDDLVSVGIGIMVGDIIFFFPAIVIVIWKIWKVLMLFIFAIVIALIGIGYLLFQQKKRS